MNSNEVKTQVEKIASQKVAIGLDDNTVLAVTRVYFSIEDDRTQEWAKDFTAAYLKEHGNRAVVVQFICLQALQEDAALLLGVTPATISRILSGRQPSRPVALLARSLLAAGGTK